MRKSIPSTYDATVSSDEIRTFKKLLREFPGTSQKIWEVQRIDPLNVCVLVGGPIAGQRLLFTCDAEGEWGFTCEADWVV